MGERLQQYLIDLVSGEGADNPLGKMVLAVLAVLSVVYQLLVLGRNAAFNRGWVHQTTLPCLVISVGNITAGGTGKTPVVQYLARFFQGQGHRVCILTRGYRSQLGSSDAFVVVSDYDSIQMGAHEAGDEAVLLAQSLPGVPVVVGKDRTRSGAAAVQQFQPSIMILDDGFQHRRLWRDVDLVVVDATRPFGNGYLLPRGFLREPLTSLKRADAVIVSRTDQVSQETLAATVNSLVRVNGCAPVFCTVHSPDLLRELCTEERLARKGRVSSQLRSGGGRGDVASIVHPPSFLKGKRVIAASGIGNPAAFVETIAGLGARVLRHIGFPDHHHYEESDINHIVGAALDSQADAVVITEKDAVKISDDLRRSIQQSKVVFYVLTIALLPLQEGQFTAYLKTVAKVQNGTS